jgi:DNA-binding transcriptional MerR regulator
MKIGELGIRVGVAPSKLRFLEGEGLIHSVRLRNGYRSYTEDAVLQINIILQAQALGFTLSEIKTAFVSNGGGKLRCETAVKHLTRRLTDIDQHQRKLRDQRKRILANIKQLKITGSLPD